MKFHIQRRTALFHEFCIIYNIFIPDSYSFQNCEENRKFTFNFRLLPKLNWRINARIYQVEGKIMMAIFHDKSLRKSLGDVCHQHFRRSGNQNFHNNGLPPPCKKVKTWMGILLQKLSLMASIFSGAFKICVLHYLPKHAF